MNRRKFFKLLGVSGVVAVFPALIKAKEKLSTPIHQTYEVMQRLKENQANHIVHPPLIGPTEFKGELWYAQGNKVWSTPLDEREMLAKSGAQRLSEIANKNIEETLENIFLMSDKKSKCFKVPTVDKAEHAAIRALYEGKAGEYQQRLALSVIVNKFSRAHDVLFIPGAADEGAFLSGRGFVGQQILKHINIPVGQLGPQEDNDENKSDK